MRFGTCFGSGRVPSSTIDLPLSTDAPACAAVSPRLARTWPWLLIASIAALATLPLWEPGALAGHSAWYDLTRLVVFDAALRAGDWLPTWSAEFYHGYGSPLFQFYAPLSYYAAEIPVLLGADFATALKVTQALALVASGFAMFALAARHASRWAACAAAILYMVAPYRFVDLYVRHALAEHCAFGWLPLIALGTERFAAEKARTGLLLGALATAGLILTHNITALIGLPVCVVIGWTLGARSLRLAPMGRAVVPAILGLGLAAFFWWPAMAGRALTHGPEALTAGYFDPQQNFATLARLLLPSWGFGGSTEADPDPMSVQIGVVHLLVVLGAVLTLRCGGPRLPWTAMGLAIVWLGASMCLAVSRPVWEALPLLSYVQFPWRFLGLVVFGAAMCAASVVDRFGPRAFSAILLATLAAYAPYGRQAWYLALDTKAEELARVPADLQRAGLATGRLAPIASVLTPGTVRRSGERATSGDDFLPRDVQTKPTDLATAMFKVSAGSVVEWTRLAPNRYRATVGLPEPGRAALHQFWFPGWTATVNGRPVEVAPAGPAALVSCAVPAGEHVVEFRYRGLPQRRVGIVVTILAGLTLVVLAAFHPMLSQMERPERSILSSRKSGARRRG